MRTAVLLASISVLAFSQAAMAQDPSHVKVAQCSPLIRQELLTIVGHPLVITFPQGESTWMAPMSGKPDPASNTLDDKSFTVEGIKPEEIQKAPIHNLITLWPDSPGTTTMTVIAQTADGALKTYPFTLRAIPDDPSALDNPAVTLNLLCRSNAVSASPAPAAAALIHGPAVPRRHVVSIAQRAEAEDRLRTDAFNTPADQACHYHAKGKRPTAIEPRCPMDNGQWTLLRFPGLSRKPAVYVGSCEDGNDEERLARQHESDDFVVVEEIAPQFCLRLGSNANDVLEIVNDHYDPAGVPTGGTLTPNVRRELIQAKGQ